MWHDVFGSSYEIFFDEFETTIRSCSEDLWLASMWDVAKDPARPRAFASDGTPHPLGNEVLSATWRVAWHALVANEFNLAGRPAGFRLAGPFAHLDAPLADGVSVEGEVVPRDPPAREDLLAYLGHNRDLVRIRLDAAREVGDGQATLGPWSGPTSTLLSMFHGNACHLIGHSMEVGMFVNQHR